MQFMMIGGDLTILKNDGVKVNGEDYISHI